MLEHESTTEWFIVGLAPKSGGFAIGIAKGIARRDSSRPLIGKKQIKTQRETFRRENENLLEVVRKGETLAFGQWRISSWRTIPSLPCRAEKTTKRTSGAQNTSRLRLVQADW